jgi:hypothetical protein
MLRQSIFHSSSSSNMHFSCICVHYFSLQYVFPHFFPSRSWSPHW